MTSGQGKETFCKGADNTYFKLCRTYGVCCNCSTLLLQQNYLCGVAIYKNMQRGQVGPCPGCSSWHSVIIFPPLYIMYRFSLDFFKDLFIYCWWPTIWSWHALVWFSLGLLSSWVCGYTVMPPSSLRTRVGLLYIVPHPTDALLHPFLLCFILGNFYYHVFKLADRFFFSV